MLYTKNIVLYIIILLLSVNCSSDSSSETEDINTETPDPSPEFSTLSKNSADFGETISIKGTNLDTGDNYIIKLDDTELAITEILSNEIKFEVPENAISGNISITFNGTSKVIGELLINLEFIGISKDYIEPGEEIEIYGKNINTTFDYSISINGVEANIKSFTTSSFVVEFPLQSSSGDILVSFNSTTLNASILSIKKVFEGNVLLSTQEEVDNFGDEGYTDITGWLRIGPEDTISTAEIQNVEKLVHIRNVETGVDILHNSALINLHGLENLSYSGALWFQVSDCASLTTLSELQIVFTDIQSLIISRNESLEDLEGLNNIGAYIGSLFILNNSKLSNIGALSNLKEIGNDLWVQNNGSLIDLDGLDNLEKVGDEVKIENNISMTSLNGLNNLVSIGLDYEGSTVGAFLYIQNNPVLENIDALSNLVALGSNLRIVSNNSLTSLSGLDNLASNSWGVEIYDNTKLNDLCALTKLFENGFTDNYEVYNNAYNPTKQNLIDGICKS